MSGFDEFKPTSLPRGEYPFTPLIAPLWADFKNGTIYYRVTNNSGLLEALVVDIALQNSAYMDFTPTVAVVATWLKATFVSKETVSQCKSTSSLHTVFPLAIMKLQKKKKIYALLVYGLKAIIIHQHMHHLCSMILPV